MRFQSTFRPSSPKTPLFVKTDPQSGQTHPRSRAGARPATERLLAICADLTSRTADPKILRETLTAAVSDVFQAPLALVLMNEGGDGPTLGAVSSEANPAENNHAGLLSHAKSFAA